MAKIPEYMDRGSRGPAVVVLQAFLSGVTGGEGFVWGEYDACLASRVGDVQAMNGIEPDGNCGPQTRAMFKLAYGFDIEAAWPLIHGPSGFMQPNGIVSIWEPDSQDRIGIIT